MPIRDRLEVPVQVLHKDGNWYDGFLEHRRQDGNRWTGFVRYSVAPGATHIAWFDEDDIRKHGLTSPKP